VGVDWRVNWVFDFDSPLVQEQCGCGTGAGAGVGAGVGADVGLSH
jgi:hypothetical protein